MLEVKLYESAVLFLKCSKCNFTIRNLRCSGNNICLFKKLTEFSGNACILALQVDK